MSGGTAGRRGMQAVVLNGPSSVGKSTLARGLQVELDEVWFVLAVDMFIAQLPLETHQLQIAEELNRILEGIHRAMSAIARAGNRVIIDHVLSIPGSAADLRRALEGLSTLWVGLTCDLAVLEHREAQRDRETGTARNQLGSVHDEINDYDIMVDTGILSPAETVDIVKATLEAAAEPPD
jgi:chloramphenicol 3-O phosphotransferase